MFFASCATAIRTSGIFGIVTFPSLAAAQHDFGTSQPPRGLSIVSSESAFFGRSVCVQPAERNRGAEEENDVKGSPLRAPAMARA